MNPPSTNAIRYRRIVTALSAISIAAMVAAVLPSSSSGGDSTPAVPVAEYLPSISDLMIGTIQPRHERLWRAAQNHDWEFVAYELGNLHGAFSRLARAHPTEQGNSLPSMIASLTEQPFNELKSAIRSKDDKAFITAYSDLTDACNSCHQALNHAVVVIGVPGTTNPSDLKAITGSHL